MFHCHVCGSKQPTDHFVDEVFFIEGKPTLVEHIPAKVCTRCGEKTFSKETTEKIRQLVQNKVGPDREVQMDVFVYG